MAKTTKTTKDSIEAWKKAHGDIYALPIGDKTAYFRKPTMLDYKRAFSKYTEGEIEFQEEMMKILFIGGDREVLENDAYFLPARKRTADFLKYPDAEVNELEGGAIEIIIEGYKCKVRSVTREDLKLAKLANPSNKPFVTQEKLFAEIVSEKDAAFNDVNVAEIRFPLYQAIELLQNQKVAQLKKL